MKQLRAAEMANKTLTEQLAAAQKEIAEHFPELRAAEMRAVGIAASRSWDELPRDRGLLAPYSWRGATALRAQRAAGRIEWHAR